MSTDTFKIIIADMKTANRMLEANPGTGLSVLDVPVYLIDTFQFLIEQDYIRIEVGIEVYDTQAEKTVMLPARYFIAS